MAKAKLTNGYDTKQFENYLREIDAADDRLEVLRSEYMNKCKGPRGDIAAVFEAMKDAGVPVRAFKTVVKNRRLNRQIERNVTKLEADDADAYETLVVSLGDFCDLPLGEAALKRAKPKGASLDAIA